MRQRPLLTFLLTLLGVILILVAARDVLVDWLWFSALGFGTVFLTIWKAKLAVFGLTLSIASGVLAMSGLLAVHAANPRARRLQLVRNHDDREGFADLFDPFSERFPWRVSVLGFAIVVGFVL